MDSKIAFFRCLIEATQGDPVPSESAENLKGLSAYLVLLGF